MLGDGKKENPNEGKTAGCAYRCTEKCVYKGRFYREGDIIALPQEEKVSHFELVKKDK